MKQIAVRTFWVAFSVFLIAGVVFAYIFRQEIRDTIAAHNFEPTAQVSELAENLALTEAGERVFFASTPTLDASQNFNQQCNTVENTEQGHILGCFTDGSIHLFNITDERLNGIVEVTAAHELLHATFARLDENAQLALARKLTELYEERIAYDTELLERMSLYKGLGDIAFANELHSVFGSEVGELPSWLEQHYSQWFTNRSIIVDYYANYRHVFDELQDKATVLQKKMTSLREKIETRSSAYDAAVDTFNTEWQSFLARNDDFEFADNPAEFYALRDDFYQRRDELKAEMDTINGFVAKYEEMRKELQELSQLNRDLEKLLNSDLAPSAIAKAPSAA